MVINKYLAEFLGTLILVFVGSMGILAVSGAGGPANLLAIGFAFGFALLAAIWMFGHVSGAHFNPAVTLGMLIDKRISLSDSIGYFVAQFAGAAMASLMIAMAASRADVAGTVTGFSNTGTAILVELVLTAIFVWLILSVRIGGFHAPLTVSLTLVGIHLAGIPFSGASVNPARSFGPALVSGTYSGLWLYLVIPMVGGIVAAGLYRLFPVPEYEED